MRFVGRKREIDLLKGLLKKHSSSLVVIRGRRRIGKTRLAEEYAKSFTKVFSLTGIPPDGKVTAETQRLEFLRQLQRHDLPIFHAVDWGELFFNLSKVCQQGRTLVFLDEITWMGSEDPEFLPKLKTAWDQYFKKNPKLVMIISGSNSSWITKNILSSTGFFGRVSLRLLLKELSLSESNQIWDSWPGTVSAFEKFKVLSVTGGVPRYLEELRPDLTAEQNLCYLCFRPEGLLFHEFHQIFHDLFQKKGGYYQSILSILGEKHLSAKQIALALNRKQGGDLSAALDDLMQAGFLARDYTWSLKTGRQSKLSCYRICDNYTRFYVKYIDPIREQIEATPLSNMPTGWNGMMGLQFENLVINNRSILHRALGISPQDIINSGPFLQTAQTRRVGCQIDYLIQTRFNTLFLCEIKFRQTPVGSKVIQEIKRKEEALQLPKGFSVRPVLIHVNGVSESVMDSGFFAKIIDFSELLEV